MYTKLNGVLVIDGEEQYNGNLEIGAFDQDGVCRGAKLPVYRSQTGRWIYLLQLRGVESYTTYTFKVYDHENEVELDLTSAVVDDNGNPIIYQGNYTYQHNGSNTNANNPISLDFTSNGSAAETFTKPIIGYVNSSEESDHWYLISSPIGNVAPGDVQGLIQEVTDDTDYDLYSFNQATSDNNEWRNHKLDPIANLEAGHGYLYASKQNDTLIFTGQAYTGDAKDPGGDSGSLVGDGYEAIFDLVFVEGSNMAGWNLMGNPFGYEASVNKDIYVMNDDGSDIIQAGTPDAPYYTNSSQLPSGYTDDPYEALTLQDNLQTKYTGDTVLHLYMNERISSSSACKSFIRRVLENYHLPYVTITPVFSICPKHGYLAGQYKFCPICDEE